MTHKKIFFFYFSFLFSSSLFAQILGIVLVSVLLSAPIERFSVPLYAGLSYGCIIFSWSVLSFKENLLKFLTYLISVAKSVRLRKQIFTQLGSWSVESVPSPAFLGGYQSHLIFL